MLDLNQRIAVVVTNEITYGQAANPYNYHALLPQPCQSIHQASDADESFCRYRQRLHPSRLPRRSRRSATLGITWALKAAAASYLGVARIVAQTEFLAIVPRQLGSALAQQENVKVLELPILLPSYKVKQHWHERYNHLSLAINFLI